jgi:hypothetical protein
LWASIDVVVVCAVSQNDAVVDKCTPGLFVVVMDKLPYERFCLYKRRIYSGRKVEAAELKWPVMANAMEENEATTRLSTWY